jgi:hypothetical protein
MIQSNIAIPDHEQRLRVLGQPADRWLSAWGGVLSGRGWSAHVNAGHLRSLMIAYSAILASPAHRQSAKQQEHYGPQERHSAQGGPATTSYKRRNLWRISSISVR